MANGDTQVEVYSPQGQFGTIPSSQMAQALSSGYKPRSAFVEAMDPKSGQTGIIPKEQWPAARAQGYMPSAREQARSQFGPSGAIGSQVQPVAANPPGLARFIGQPLPKPPGGGEEDVIRSGAPIAAKTMIEAGAGGELGSMARLAKLGLLGRIGAVGGGAALGNVAGNIATGQKPTVGEAASTGVSFGMGEPIGEAAAGITKFAGKQIAKLAGETPERMAALKALPQQEGAINQRIVQAEAQSRAAFKAAYPPIDEAPVNVAATKNLAKQAADNIVSARVPAPVSRVAAIPEPSANLLTSDDPATILKELAGFDNIPFRKAQLYRSAIEQFISRAGGKLPSDVYGQLKAVSGSLGDGLRATASQEGQLAQFETAEGMFKQHAADFWNKGAPLKPLLNAQPDATGQTLNKFMQTANRARIMQALERRGVQTADIKGLLADGDKPLKANIKDAAIVKQLGPDVFNQQVGSANREAAKKFAVKTGLGVTGLGGLAELVRLLGNQQKTQR